MGAKDIAKAVVAGVREVAACVDEVVSGKTAQRVVIAVNTKRGVLPPRRPVGKSNT